MTFNLYQINLTREQIEEVNSYGREEMPHWYKTYLRTRHRPDQMAILDAVPMYEHVAGIEASHLEEVFEIGNVGPEERIARHRPMHSVSVGDLVADPEGFVYLCAPIGWVLVPFMETHLQETRS